MSDTYFAIPTRGKLNWQCARAIAELGSELDAEPHFQIGHLSVAANRNLICENFLASQADVLFMLDDDVMPAMNAYMLVDDLDDFDIVAGAVPIWREQDSAPSYAAFDSEQKPIIARDQLLEAAYVGTGCIAIKRKVVEWCGGFGASQFRDEVRDGRHVSDDVLFCEQARLGSFTIACDFRVRCDHWVDVSLHRVLTLVEQSATMALVAKTKRTLESQVRSAR